MKLITKKKKSKPFKQNEDDGLTFVNSGIVFDGCWHWFRFVTIPIDGIKCD